MSIFSFLESALTPPGTNARRSQENQQREAAGMAMDMLKQYWPSLQKQFKFKDEMMPVVQNLIMQQIANRSQKNQIGRANSMRAGATAGATRTGRQVANAGGGTGLAKGATVAHLNQGHTAANEFLARENDPRMQADLNMQIAQMINGMGQPDLNPMNAGMSMVFGQPQVHVGKGLGEVLGEIAGSVAGGKASAGGF